MPIIEWTTEFSTGHQGIDGQHKQWIAIYNSAHNRMMKGLQGDISTLGMDVLKEMIEYTQYHFAYEEQFMTQIGYADIDAHKQLHKSFIQQLDQIVLERHQGCNILNSEVVKVIENWLVEHILMEVATFRSALGKGV